MLYKRIFPPQYNKLPTEKRTISLVLVFVADIVLLCFFTIGMDMNSFLTIFWGVVLFFIGRAIVLKKADIRENEVNEQNDRIFNNFHKFPLKVCTGKRLANGNSALPPVDFSMWIDKEELHFSSVAQKDDFGEIVIPLKNISFFQKNQAGAVLFLSDGSERAEFFFDSNGYNSLKKLIPNREKIQNFKQPSNFNTNNIVINIEAPQEKKGAKCAYCGKYIPYGQTTCPDCGAENPAYDRIDKDEIERLNELKDLLDRNAISSQEYERLKKQIIN